ncbi:MAG: hypothetical protein AAF655_18075 [Bacteroidota bacterium]
MIASLGSCIDPFGSNEEKLKIELESVGKIYIKNEFYGTDSIFLNEKQSKLFIEEWNNSNPIGLSKMMVEYWVFVELKNNSARSFRINKKSIKENNGWTYSLSDSALIDSFWQPIFQFPNPKNYNPISFINTFSSIGRRNNGAIFGLTMLGDFPQNWVKEEHLDSLMNLLESKDVCACYINALSSYLPTNDYAEKGGYARLFIQAFKENKQVALGSHGCPKVDESQNEEIIEWWKERKQN